MIIIDFILIFPQSVEGYNCCMLVTDKYYKTILIISGIFAESEKQRAARLLNALTIIN